MKKITQKEIDAVRLKAKEEVASDYLENHQETMRMLEMSCYFVLSNKTEIGAFAVIAIPKHDGAFVDPETGSFVEIYSHMKGTSENDFALLQKLINHVVREIG